MRCLPPSHGPSVDTARNLLRSLAASREERNASRALVAEIQGKVQNTHEDPCKTYIRQACDCLYGDILALIEDETRKRLEVK